MKNYHYVLRHPNGNYYHNVFGKLATDIQSASRYLYKNSAESHAGMLLRDTGVRYTVVECEYDKQTGFLTEVSKSHPVESTG